jgi:hypothetical protein
LRFLSPAAIAHATWVNARHRYAASARQDAAVPA